MTIRVIVLRVVADRHRRMGERRGDLLIELGLCGLRTLLEKQPIGTGASRIRRVGKPQGGVLGDRIGITRLLDVQHPTGDQAAALRQDRGQPGRRDFVEGSYWHSYSGGSPKTAPVLTQGVDRNLARLDTCGFS